MGHLKGFIGETIVYGFANVFSRVFAMVLIFFYVDYLSKDEYANLFLLQSVFIVITFALMLSSGVFYYYYVYERTKYRKIIFTSWFYFQLVVVALFIGLIVLFAPYLQQIFIQSESNSEQLFYGLLIVGLQLIPYTINITNINLFRIDRKPKVVLVIALLEAIFTLIIAGVGLVYFNFNIVEILLSQLVSRTLVALLFIRRAIFYMNINYYSKKMLAQLVKFSWPYFIISLSAWAAITMDKFIGAGTLTNKDEVAFLALAMQITIPIAVLADMIRMSIGPFIMSIRKDKDADKSYQQIFDLSVFSGLIVLMMVLFVAPFLIELIADDTYLPAVQVIPLIALASVLSIVANQFTISYALVKKNALILIAFVTGSLLGLAINIFFMREHGFMVSGVSQVVSFIVIATILFFIGKSKTELNLKLTTTGMMIAVTVIVLSLVYYFMENLKEGDYTVLMLSSLGGIVLITAIYLIRQRISIRKIANLLTRKGNG